MTTAIANRTSKDAVGITSEFRSVEAIMEVAFTFLFKGARRLAQLNPREAGVLKKLFVEFTHAPDNRRSEIMETIIEVVLPEDFVGGVASESQPDHEVRAKVDAARLYIAQQIRQRREGLDMIQADLARKAGIPQSHVSRLESGKHAPTKATIERIATALDVHPSMLDPGYSDAMEDGRH